MSDQIRLLVIGGGAQAKYVLETCGLMQVEVIAVMNLQSDHELTWVGYYNTRVVPFDLSAHNILRLGATHAIICTASPKEKERLWNIVSKVRLRSYSVIHPTAIIASTAKIGMGTIINAGSIIQPFAKIGNGVMIHSNVVIEHDVTVDNFANIAPNVTLAGWVKIGKSAIIYTGCNIIPTIEIGDFAIIGAGATVISNIPAQCKVAGVPAKEISTYRGEVTS
ncbi:hypothetical protein [Legionella oakridgensis]|uniref:Serine acetyltransferase n=2 Tax=Legionella oakridgensis TaxID=29423 RepID=W0B532_9GAMM|nr:hypothetical protein [Legionella oakridgensis]AHE65633.1 serine acetyltransferase [Legionella oakridgensis ATCC 33761 = DSM 21215]KTD38278.1 chloramphenicol acetyltransferase [Legionella oakridgensis]STY15590.1 acetyltransferase [Legionella longbeachae]